MALPRKLKNFNLLLDGEREQLQAAAQGIATGADIEQGASQGR